MIVQIAFAAVLSAAIAVPAQNASVPELLILGSPHFANHNRDIANAHVEDVRTPERQLEIEAVVARLAAFHPTRVAVEWSADQQARLDERYADYRAGRYQLSADEIDQIGLRLAARLHLARVDAVNWLADDPGTDADYDFIAWADAHGRGAEWRVFQQKAQEEADAGTRLMTCTPISAWLRRGNTPAARRADQRAYYDIARFGDHAANPGAAWVGAWYARNLRILDNLRRIAGPGDRVLLVIGGGHGFLLDQQARESGAFRVADTLAYLPTSPRDSWTRCRS
ncbi:MAG TPA: DUF5694 domain-containing protein [Sphingomicrobium sp.]|nr:DUF5694 domain-containing protein [Sphingomicrobium sp.]